MQSSAHLGSCIAEEVTSVQPHEDMNVCPGKVLFVHLTSRIGLTGKKASLNEAAKDQVGCSQGSFSGVRKASMLMLALSLGLH